MTTQEHSVEVNVAKIRCDLFQLTKIEAPGLSWLWIKYYFLGPFALKAITYQLFEAIWLHQSVM